jgi:predicted DNA-binding protein (MmcQ/YjbR family)
MTLEEFNLFCGSLKSTTNVIQWGGASVWKVGGKVFALCGIWGDDKHYKVVFKASELAYDILREQPGIISAPYLGRYKWIQVQDPEAMNDEDVQAYISTAYGLVVKKLTKAKRQELGLI